MVVVDTNVILDVLERQPNWWQWSIQQMRQLSQARVLTINPIIYAELAPSHSSVNALDRKIATMNLVLSTCLVKPHSSPAKPISSTGNKAEQKRMFFPISSLERMRKRRQPIYSRAIRAATRRISPPSA